MLDVADLKGLTLGDLRRFVADTSAYPDDTPLGWQSVDGNTDFIHSFKTARVIHLYSNAHFLITDDEDEGDLDWGGVREQLEPPVLVFSSYRPEKESST